MLKDIGFFEILHFNTHTFQHNLKYYNPYKHVFPTLNNFPLPLCHRISSSFFLLSFFFFRKQGKKIPEQDSAKLLVSILKCLESC